MSSSVLVTLSFLVPKQEVVTLKFTQILLLGPTPGGGKDWRWKACYLELPKALTVHSRVLGPEKDGQEPLIIHYVAFHTNSQLHLLGHPL